METTDAPQIIEHIHESVTFTPYETRWGKFTDIYTGSCALPPSVHLFKLKCMNTNFFYLSFHVISYLFLFIFISWLKSFTNNHHQTTHQTVPCSAKLAVLGIYPKGTGVIKICELQKGKLNTIAEKESKVGFKCGTFGASSLDNRAIATGDFDGNVQVWDLERMDLPSFSVKGHDQIINCIDGCGGLSIGNGAPELVTGSRDGCVRVWDPRVQEAVVSLEPEEGADGARDCWTVA